MKGLTPLQRERKMITIAAYLCYLQYKSLDSKNIKSFLTQAGHDGGELLEPEFLKLFDTHSSRVQEVRLSISIFNSRSGFLEKKAKQRKSKT